MKVLICINNSIRFCPYVNIYIDICRKKQYDFCVLYPDRGLLYENVDFPTIRYAWDKKKSTIIQLLNYRRFALKTIEKNHYDFLCVLTTGAAVLLSKALKNMYGNYLVDIRDYTRENNPLYYSSEKRVIEKAKGAVISSPFFRRFLIDREYIEIFNAPEEIEESSVEIELNHELPIRIAYVGTIAYPEQCEKLMLLVEKDRRFIFDLYGNDLNGSRIENFIAKNKLTNSRFHGPYLPAEKKAIIQNVDILFNAYGNDSPLLRYALSNKLSDAVIHKKVVLNSPETCMNEILGICSYAMDFDEIDGLDGLYEWYRSLNADLVENHLEELLQNIRKTNICARSRLEALFDEINNK